METNTDVESGMMADGLNMHKCKWDLKFSYRFETTSGWVYGDRSLIFGWIIPLKLPVFLACPKCFLILSAPGVGIDIRPLKSPEQPDTSPEYRTTWSKTWLDNMNRGGACEAGLKLRPFRAHFLVLGFNVILAVLAFIL